MIVLISIGQASVSLTLFYKISKNLLVLLEINYLVIVSEREETFLRGEKALPQKGYKGRNTKKSINGNWEFFERKNISKSLFHREI